MKPRAQKLKPNFGVTPIAPQTACAPAEAGPAASIGVLPAEIRHALLDPAIWRKALEEYARATHLAVALADTQGQLIGEILNPQPLWTVLRNGKAQEFGDCPFSLSPLTPCSCFSQALGKSVIVLDRLPTGLVHFTVPLVLAEHQIGVMIAGQVFDQYPQNLPLDQAAREAGLSGQKVWEIARRSNPVSPLTVHVYAELLATLASNLLSIRHHAIVEATRLAEMTRLRDQLQESQSRLKLAVEAAHLVPWQWTLPAKPVKARTEEWLSELPGSFEGGFELLLVRVHPEDREHVFRGLAHALQQRENYDAEFRVVQPDESVRWMAARGKLVREGGASARLIGIVADVTERKHRDEALYKKQKMESLGVLAGGVAHDFNNLLVGILGGTIHTLDLLSDTHPAREMLEIAIKSSHTAADLARKMLAFSGRGPFELKVIDLSEQISEGATLVRSLIPKNVRLQLEIEDHLPTVRGDGGQIQQIFMNLVLNAAEAIGGTGGIVAVGTGVEDMSERAARQLSIGRGITPGRYVYLEVQDTGSGMTSETASKIFDPFFTTKFPGRGLGLAAVSGIVEGHKGGLRLRSAYEQGTTFRVLFPALDCQVLKPPIITFVTPEAFRSGTVLVVDDEEMVRGMAKTFLERLGFKVVLAQDGTEAVRLFRDIAADITLVLLDLTMPGMDGHQTLLLLHEIRKDIPVLISSGYDEGEVTRLFGKGAIGGIIQKPYILTSLAEKINLILGRAGERSFSGEPKG